MNNQTERTRGKAVDSLLVREGLADQETKDYKPLAINPVGVARVRETHSLKRASVGEAHGILQSI